MILLIFLLIFMTNMAVGFWAAERFWWHPLGTQASRVYREINAASVLINMVLIFLSPFVIGWFAWGLFT